MTRKARNSHISKNGGPVKPFLNAPRHSLLRVVLFAFFDPLHRRPRLVRNLTVRPKHLSDQNFDHDYYFKLPFAGSGMPNQVDDVLLHAMYEYELSRVRTELD